MKRQDVKKRPLSDTVLLNLEPESVVYRVLDGKGLYLRVKPGGQKSWELRYKRHDGKWTWLGLGSYPRVSGALARKQADELNADIASGQCPRASRLARQFQARQASQNTFECLAREWHSTRLPGWQPGTGKQALSALEKHVFPVFAYRPFNDIQPLEWMEFFRGLQRKGILSQSGRIRRYCSEIYDLARVTGRSQHNPIEGLRRFLQSSRTTNYSHVSAQELPSLLRAIRDDPHSPEVRIGLRLLCLLAVRPSELREAHWSEFDLERRLWTIPAERMKKRREHLVPLSRQALAALRALREITGQHTLLFPGRVDDSKPRSNTVFLMALRRLGYQGRQTGHGFRHIASTLLHEHDFNPNHIEAQLSHVKGGVAGVYNKARYLEQRAVMMQWYADHLDALEIPRNSNEPASQHEASFCLDASPTSLLY